MVYRHVIVISNNTASGMSSEIAKLTKKMAEGGFVIDKSEYRNDSAYSIALTFAKDIIADEISQMPKQVEKLLAAEVE